MLIAIGAFLYSVVNAILMVLYPDRFKRGPSEIGAQEEEPEDEEEEPIVVQAKRELPPPPPIPEVKRSRELPPQERFRKEKFAFETKMDGYRQKTAIEDRSLHIDLRAPEELISDAVRLGEVSTVIQHEKPAKMDTVVRSLSSKKMLWIAHEIVSAPLALRHYSSHYGPHIHSKMNSIK